MGYRIRAGSTSSTWSPTVVLLVAALIAGLLGMHVLAGHGSPAAGADPTSHAAMVGPAMSGASTGDPVSAMAAVTGDPVSAMAAVTGDPVSAMATVTGDPVSAPMAADATALVPSAHHDAAPAGLGHGCADCAEHAAMAEACVLAPVAPAALPGPPAEDLRPAIAASVVVSPANDPADPRPPSISVLCISRR